MPNFYSDLPIRAACIAIAMASLTAGAVQAQPLAPNAEPAVVRTLVASANFWRSQKNFAYARRELERALLVAPLNAAVLADSAELALDTGDTKAADEYRQRLGRVAPDGVRTKALAAERALTPAEAAQLAEARRLAQEGKAAAAIEKYAALLRDGVPPANLQVEYYTQLGATQDGFDQAAEKLGALAEQSPADAQLQLAFARLETLHEEARSDGLKRLAQLAGVPEVSDAARQSWHDALSWQGASEKARTQLMAYLERYPSDSVLEAKQKEYDAVLPDASAKAMIRGYNLMVSDMHGAEREFRAALASNPKNPDAMSMLAAIYRTWKRPAEAQVLLNRAAAIAPERRAELYANAGGDFAGQIAIGKDELVQVASLTATGRYSDAEQLLSSLVTGHATVPLLVQLAGLQQRAGHLDDALATVRNAQQLAPASADADCTLAEVLLSASRYDDASASLDTAQQLYAKANSTVGLRRVSTIRAALRKAQQTQASNAAPAPRRVAVASR